MKEDAVVISCLYLKNNRSNAIGKRSLIVVVVVVAVVYLFVCFFGGSWIKLLQLVREEEATCDSNKSNQRKVWDKAEETRSVG